MPLPEPLREGDRLSGRQFLRRWDAMPDLKRAELIGGVVFMASPLSFGHGTAASYREIEPGADGLLRSRVFPGLWLHPAALWDVNKSIRAAVEQGIETPEHATFVARLHAAAATSTSTTRRSAGGGGGRGPASRGRR